VYSEIVAIKLFSLDLITAYSAGKIKLLTARCLDSNSHPSGKAMTHRVLVLPKESEAWIRGARLHRVKKFCPNYYINTFQYVIQFGY
jgi:hypothetical protein